MNITDELREYASTRISPNKGQLIAIADRIDAEHENAMSSAERLLSNAGQLLADVEKDRDYNYANWQECKQKVLQGNLTFNELNAKIECLEDELSHCIELPKDADGEYIHIGDVLTDGAEFKSEGNVIRLMLEDEGWMIGFGCGGWTEPSIHEWHHYHAPTVEDLLFSYGQACIRTSNEADTDAAKQTMLARLREDYAAKLRLADDGEE